MPIQYIKPSDITNSNRPIEFWKTGRGGEINLFLTVPFDWDDGLIDEELRDWASQYFSTSDFTRFGWNEEKDFGSRK